MASKQPRHHNKISKADHKGPGVAPALPAGIKGYKKIYPAELPVIDISSGHNITNIRDALIQYCQRELGPISSIFTELKYKAPATATFDAAAVTADTSGVLKEQASAKLKRADIENEKYELSKPKLHGLLSGMTTREVDDRIVNYRNAKAIAEEQRRAAEDKPGETRARPPDESQCPLALWKAIVHVTTSRTIGNIHVDQNNLTINFANIRQKPNESVNDFKNRINNLLDSYDAVQLPRPSQASIALRFLHGLDNDRYGSLKVYLGNELANDRDLYQPTLDLAAGQATRWLAHGGKRAGGQPENAQAPINAFVADAKGKKGGKPDKKFPDSKTANNETMICEFCGNKGHVMSKCFKFEAAQKAAKAATAEKKVKFSDKKTPYPKVAGALYANTDDTDSDYDIPHHKDAYHMLSFLAGKENLLGDYDLILDTGANGSIVRNKALLHNISRQAPLTFGGIGGSITTSRRGRIRDLCEAYYHESSPANIVSFSQLQEAGHKIELIADTFVVHTPVFRYQFKLNEGGLYICDLTPISTALITTVADNKTQHSKREVIAATEARLLQERLANPPDNKMSQAIANGNIVNAKILPADIVRAQAIYGPNTHALQGRTVTRTADPFPVPQESSRDTSPQSVYIDVFMANGVSFLITVAKPLEHILATCIESRDTATLRKAVRTHLAFYSSRRIPTPILYSDNEGGIVALQSELAGSGIQLITSGPGMHVHVVERAIRYIKEGVRSVHAGLPYACPRAIFKHLIPFVALRLNIFPSSTRTDKLSAFQLVYNRSADAKRDCHLTFGGMYHITCKDRAHTMAVRTVAAIGVGQIPNGTGTCMFFTIDRHSIVAANHFVALPFTADMIRHMNRLAGDDKASTTIDAPYYIHGRPITCAENIPNTPSPPAPPSREATLVPIHTVTPTTSEVPHIVSPLPEMEEDAGYEDAQDLPNAYDSPLPPNTLPTPADMLPAAPTDITRADDIILPPTEDTHDIALSSTEDNHDMLIEASPPTQESRLPPTLDPPSAPPAPIAEPRYPVRERKPPNRLSLTSVFHITAKRALREDPATARPAIEAELRTLIAKGVFRPVKSSTLTADQRRSVIRSQLNVTQKYLPTTDGTGRIKDKVKARLVGGGDCQDRGKYTASETSSPTVSTTAIFLIAQIAAAEGRDITTIDIGSAYLNASMPKTDPSKLVFMRINKEVSQIMTDLDLTFLPFINSDGTLIVELDRALYGCIESALLWFQELSGFLTKTGFVPNPYDPCVMNRKSKAGLATLGIYVDDILLTCSNPTLASTIIQELEDEYKQLKVTRGLSHNYLGMVLDFRDKGVVHVSQSGMIEEIAAAPGIAALIAAVGQPEAHPKTPATENLFRSTAASPPLESPLAKVIHSLTARILFVANRARPDLLTFISFMTKKVLSPTQEDGRKLLRALRFMAHTSDAVLTLGYRGVPSLYVFIDASFATHTDMKSHTGVFCTLGTGALYTKSTTQKINTTSSCEAELVALAKGLQQTLWARTFLIGQGFTTPPITIYQDNQSTIKLIERGRPAAEQSRHINIGYFWIHDLIKQGVVIVKFCPTLSMLADYFTKPLQGSLFTDLRDQVLGAKAIMLL